MTGFYGQCIESCFNICIQGEVPPSLVTSAAIITLVTRTSLTFSENLLVKHRSDEMMKTKGPFLKEWEISKYTLEVCTR